ncbi:MAG: DUF1624 domain-containing protein [Candidatus Magasanikbacteria bacterium]|nr:DUF1624 domain-containing protein [Candidatus Magasanikbacteria bacterium]
MQLPSLLKCKRIDALDFLRGSAVFFMLITHINAVFLKDYNLFLDKLTWFGATICFSTFLFCFAFIYGLKISKHTLNKKRQIKRALQILVIYYISAFFAAFFLYGHLRPDEIFDIVILKHIPLYTEFILAFVFYIILVILIEKPLKKAIKYPIPLLLFSIGIYLLSSLLYTIETSPQLLITLKNLFVGHEAHHTFGVLSYFPIFILGFLSGAIKKKKYKKKFLISLFAISTISLIFLRVTGLSVWYRWPPSTLFLLYGISYAFFIGISYSYIKKITYLNKYFIHLGKNALHIFLLNIIVILGFSFLVDYEKYPTQRLLFIHLVFLIIISAIVISYEKVKKIRIRKLNIHSLFLYITAIISIISISACGYLFVVKAMKSEVPNFLNIIHNKNVCESFSYRPSQLIDFSTNKTWLLLGDEFTDKEKTLTLSVDLINTINYTSINNQIQNIQFEIIDIDNSNSVMKGYFPTSTKDNISLNSFTTDIDINALPIGSYHTKITASFKCGDIAEEYKQAFHVSYPYYLIWSIDWEGYDVKEQHLHDMDEITEKHHDIPMSHFLNPRLLTTDTISEERKTYLKNWLLDRHYLNGGEDSIDLHLHMFFDLAEDMGITLEKEKTLQTNTTTMTTTTPPEQWGYYLEDGYDVTLSNLEDGDMDKALKFSLDIFEKNDFPKPKAFRAGGWFADTDTLHILEDNGFLIDTSGRSAYTFGTNNLEGPWTLSETAQPYKPNRNNQNSREAPQMNLWEFPNNGGDSWKYNTQQIKKRFEKNWKSEIGLPLKEKRILILLSHPEWFYVDKPKMNDLFNYTDTFLYLNDNGPVLYINFDDIYDIWEIN